MYKEFFDELNLYEDLRVCLPNNKQLNEALVIPKEDTNTNYEIWIYSKERAGINDDDVRVSVKIHKDAYVSVYLTTEGATFKNLQSAVIKTIGEEDAKRILNWVNTHRDAIIKYWNGQMKDRDALNALYD